MPQNSSLPMTLGKVLPSLEHSFLTRKMEVKAATSTSSEMPGVWGQEYVPATPALKRLRQKEQNPRLAWLHKEPLLNCTIGT